jgi:hypothetical protein
MKEKSLTVNYIDPSAEDGADMDHWVESDACRGERKSEGIVVEYKTTPVSATITRFYPIGNIIWHEVTEVTHEDEE